VQPLTKNFRSRFQNDGFTLVEVLLSLVIAAIFSGVVMTVFLMSTKSFQTAESMTDVRTEADTLVTSLLTTVTSSGFDYAQVSADGTELKLFDARPTTIDPVSGLLVRSGGNTSLLDPVPILTIRLGEGGLTLDSESSELVLMPDIGASRFDIKSPESVTVDGETYHSHGVLQVMLAIQSKNDDERITLKSGIGF